MEGDLIMDKIKVVFMGTPDFAVPILEGLIENYDVVGVVSQPDRKVGRKQEIVATPTKQVALNHNIKVFQPINIRDDYSDILGLNPDIIGVSQSLEVLTVSIPLV